MITKPYPTRSHTGAAQGGMCAALANVEEDNWEWHTFDTIKGGDYLVDQDAAEVMCREAIEAVYDLEHMGMPFNRTPTAGSTSGASAATPTTTARGRCAAPASPPTAPATILQTLFQQNVKQGTTFFDEYYVLDLLRDPGDGRAAGVVAFELATGELHVFRAKAVVFCTGGFGKMFKITSNAHALTGDGPGVCYRRGVPMEDMEFFQFHPTGLYRLGVLLSEAARGEGGILRNADGEAFMERYAPTIKDLAPRDMVSRAIYTEIREGRRRARRRLCLPRREPPRPQGDRRQAARHHRVRPHLPGRRAQEGGRADPADGPLRHGRHPHQRARRGGGRRRQHGHPGAVRGRRVRLCVGARRQPARHQLAARHRRVRQAAGVNAGEYAAGAGHADLGEDPAGAVARMLGDLAAHPQGERAAAIRGDLQTSMDDKAGVYRTETLLKEMEVELACCASATPRSGSRTPPGATTPTCWRRSSSASCSTWPRPWSSRPGPAPRAAAATSARTTRPATTSTGSSTPGPAHRRRGQARLQAGHHDPVRADGTAYQRPTRSAADCPRLPTVTWPAAAARPIRGMLP